MINRYKITALLISGALSLAGCLEHNYDFKVHPNGVIDCHIFIRGDLVDMDDGMDIFPDTSVWQVSRRIEEGEKETVHIIEANAQLDNPLDLSSLFNWSKEPADSLHLRRAFDLKVEKNILFSRWRFSGLFISRSYNRKYGDIWDYVPAECRVLEDEAQLNQMSSSDVDLLEKKFALGVIQWNRARFECVFERIWMNARRSDSSLADTSSIEYNIARSGWFDDLHRYLNLLDVPKPEVVNLDWWVDLRPQFLGRFADFLPMEKIDFIADIADAVEREYLITRDMRDDIYRVRISLPGWTLKTDGQKDSGDCIWEFTGEYLHNEDGVINAESIQFDFINMTGIILIIAIGLSLIYFYRKSRKTAAN